MPIIKSAKKKMKQDIVRRDRNKALKSFMKNLKKKTMSLFNGNPKSEELTKAVDEYKSQVDKAWSKGIFKRNKSSRLKSKIDHLVAKKLGSK